MKAARCLLRSEPQNIHDLRPQAISRSFCPCRAGCRGSRSLASRCMGELDALFQSERRASGEFVHVELTPGIVTILPAWKFDPIYCATLKIGVPRVSLAALDDLHRLLIAFELRLLSANGNTVTQEAHDGITGTARPGNEDCPDTEVCSPDSTAPARPRSRRRPHPRRDCAQRRAALQALAQLLLEASGIVMTEAGDDDA